VKFTEEMKRIKYEMFKTEFALMEINLLLSADKEILSMWKQEHSIENLEERKEKMEKILVKEKKMLELLELMEDIK